MEEMTTVNMSVTTADLDYIDKIESYFCPQFTFPEKTYTYVNNSHMDDGLLMVADTTLSYDYYDNKGVHPFIYSTPSPLPRLQSLPVNSTSADTSTGEDYDTFAHLEDIFYRRISVAVCVFGVVGNLLNLLVLSQKGLKRTLGRLEGFSYAGLIALACSDLCFCLCIIPYSQVDVSVEAATTRTFSMLYLAYSNGLVNVFLTASTWLTVMLAVGRYFVTCHPFRAREVIGAGFAWRILIAIFIMSILINIPRFWQQTIKSLPCPGGPILYVRDYAFLKLNYTAFTTYMWLHFFFIILLPLLFMTYCNIQLIRVLRQSTKTRTSNMIALRAERSTLRGRTSFRSKPHTYKADKNSARITLTLVAVILMFLLLVVPVEFWQFITHVVTRQRSSDLERLLLAIGNSLQACNFSFNFVLYCAINAHFRRTVGQLLRCRKARWRWGRWTSSSGGNTLDLDPSRNKSTLTVRSRLRSSRASNSAYIPVMRVSHGHL